MCDTLLCKLGWLETGKLNLELWYKFLRSFLNSQMLCICASKHWLIRDAATNSFMGLSTRFNHHGISKDPRYSSEILHYSAEAAQEMSYHVFIICDEKKGRSQTNGVQSQYWIAVQSWHDIYNTTFSMLWWTQVKITMKYLSFKRTWMVFQYSSRKLVLLIETRRIPKSAWKLECNTYRRENTDCLRVDRN